MIETPKSIKSWLEVVHSVLFPRRCAGCRAKGSYLCEPCASTIPRRGYYGEQVTFTSAPYSHSAVRQLVWLLKFRGVKEVADIFAGWIYDCLLEELAELSAYRAQGGKIIIIPVPLSKKRFRQRGYNQAEEIARRLVALDPKIFRLEINNLAKIKETPAQVSVKTRAARLANLRGAFKLKNGRAFRGRTIILLDDVSTTGTTLSEASHAFGHARPRRIIKIAVAGG